MGNCDCANCGKCQGCGRSLSISEAELLWLERFGQIPFLPVGRKREDMIPVYPEEPDGQTSLILQCLERKGLISIDYDSPLSGSDPAQYGSLPVRGSMALTRRGQWVLETAQIQGIAPEDGENAESLL